MAPWLSATAPADVARRGSSVFGHRWVRDEPCSNRIRWASTRCVDALEPITKGMDGRGGVIGTVLPF